MLTRNIFLIALLMCVSGVMTCMGQTTGSHHENGIMTAPPILETEKSGVMKLDNGDQAIDPVQKITITSERGAGNGSGTNSPTAVPGNNDCSGAITLTVNAACVTGTNKEATTQSGENTACQGSVNKTVWYRFTATNANMFVEVERTASSGCYLSSAVFSGNCLPSSSISCEDAGGGPNLNIHDLTGLTVGTVYYIQVSYTAGGPCGNNSNNNTGADFCIKVGETQNCSTCNTPCGPVCVFPTAPTVAQVTSTCTQYQLKPRLNAGQSKKQCYTFTAVATSFSLQMIINSVGCGMGGNVSTFNWELYPSNCSGIVQSGTLSNLNASGLSIGSQYVLCYNWVSTCQHNSVYPYIVATSPLPVELLYFSGKQVSKNILLNWSTASEHENKYFSVQRSADGIAFEEAGKVNGAGNSTQLSEYAFLDFNPIKGVNYYRLAQYDYDGSVEYSEIVAVRYFDKSTVKIGANPVADNLQITVQSKVVTQLSIEIINSIGETIFESSKMLAKGTNTISIPVDSFTKGVYFLKTETDEGSTWTRFVKL